MDQEGSQVTQEIQVTKQDWQSHSPHVRWQPWQVFLLSKTLPEFDTAAKKVMLMWAESYNEFAHCLDRPALTAGNTIWLYDQSLFV